MEGDPVYALICVRNQDTVGFRDLADMEPTGHFLGLDIRSGTIHWRRRIHSEIGYTLEGPELEPGGCACEGVKLTHLYGHSLDGKDQARFPPGDYRVVARFAARLGVTRLPQIRVQSDTVSFSVVPRTMPAGYLTLDSLLHDTEEQISTARVLQIAQSTGASAVHTAIQIEHRIRVRRVGDEVRCVLDTMDRKIRYKSLYFSYGP
jgi:hypothetical protein